MAERIVTSSGTGYTITPSTPTTITDATTTNHTFTITLDSGYEFTEMGQIIRWNKHKTTGDLSKPYNMSIANLPTTTARVSLTVNQYTTTDVHIEVNPVSTTNEYPIINNTVGFNLDKVDVIEGGQQVVRVTLVDGYRFYLAGVGGATISHRVAGGSLINYVATQTDQLNGYVDIAVNVTGEVEFTGNAIEYEPSNPDVNVTFNMVNCTTTFEGSTIPQGEQQITFIADDGYEFRGVSSWIADGQVNPIEFYPTGTEYTLTLDVPAQDVTISISAYLVVEGLGSFTNIYLTNVSELGELSLQRFQDVANVDPEYDYGKMIMNIIEVPFKVPIEMYADIMPITLGRHVTTVNSQLLNSYILTVNIGSIVVNEEHGNLLDYANTNTFIHLPYAERIELPIEYVMGYTISVKYKIDFYSGECTIIITSSINGGLIIHTDVVAMSSKIPFIQFDNNRLMNKTSLILDNGIKTAFIEVIRNIPIISSEGVDTVKDGYLREHNGYVEVEHIQLSSMANASEQNEITNLLRNGVFING